MGKEGNRQYDVVVVGAGYAGLAAALEAARAGISVVVLARHNPFASNSALGGGAFALAGTPFQRGKGIWDSAELFAEDLLRANRRTIPEEVVVAAARESAQLYEWLTELGVRFYEVMKFPGHSVARDHLEIGISGANVLRLLLQAVRKHGAHVRLGTVAEHLILGSNQEVQGVQAADAGEKIAITAKKAVVLAAGGFGKNPSMLKRWLPHLAKLSSLSGAGSTGDGIRMGIEAGAKLYNMDAAMVTSLGSVRRGFRILGIAETLANGAILVNKQGQRFTDESGGYTQTSMPVLHQPGSMALLIFDEDILSRVEKVKRFMEKYLKDGLFHYGKTTSELAKAAGIEPRSLQQTVDRYFPSGRLYGTWVKPAIIMTHGGLVVNSKAQVIHQNGYPVSHLYAGGDNTPGLGGAATPDCPCPGYLTGTGYLWALASGRIAGRNAAKESSG